MLGITQQVLHPANCVYSRFAQLLHQEVAEVAGYKYSVIIARQVKNFFEISYEIFLGELDCTCKLGGFDLTILGSKLFEKLIH